MQAGHSAAVLRDCPPACGLLLDVATHSSAVARLYRESGVVEMLGESLGSLDPAGHPFWMFGDFYGINTALASVV